MNIPKPYCINRESIKALVLGCDPTAFDKHGNLRKFEYVFDLGNDKRYFNGILKNLQLVGVQINEIYVQNLVTEYQSKETSKNQEWNLLASKSIPARKNEFDRIDGTSDIPVFLTSEVIYKVLLKRDCLKIKARDFYEGNAPIPVSATDNYLGRPLFPLYRHPYYKLELHENYAKKVKSYFANM
ncbi:hypothetical protein D1614_22735 [Maribellus luteus]|uniref:Uncharacterized protein n=1 Tax=Maribellus luteus TaxID=2305463 RepID=A0A399SP70_9BACT|nr:hypothetical protein [Maribellus luteus]RIJ45490.1 hypothetical protein D1614_22735 [Maribellus luteus]